MGGELEPRREQEFSFEASTSDWLSHFGKLSVAYRYRRQGRARQFVEATAEYAETDEESLVERATDNERFGDAFVLAGQQAVTTADPELCDLFARLVARAFQDDARIEATSVLLGLVEQLGPVHLRVLRGVSMVPRHDPTFPPHTDRVEALVNADPGLTLAALLSLRSLGLVASTESTRTGPPGSSVRFDPPEWALTDLGRELLRIGGALGD